MMAPGNFQAWYPIVTPPGYTTKNFGVPTSNYAPPTPGSYTQQAAGQPDMYRPDYRQNSLPTQGQRQTPTSRANIAQPAMAPPSPTDQFQQPVLNGMSQQHPGQETTSRMLEIGAVDDSLEQGFVPRFSQLSVGDGDDPVIDTGATHHLTSKRDWGPLFSDPGWANRDS